MDSRENLLDFIDTKKFDKIKQEKKICVIGCGGVGSNLLHLLVRGGFLNLRIVDFDVVDQTNLSRQLFKYNDIGKKKTFALKYNLLEINKNLNIEIFDEKLNYKNAQFILDGLDLIVDATDNFESRRIINNFCEKKNKDWLYNGAIKTEFISSIFKGSDKLFNKIFKDSVKDQKADYIGVLNSTPMFCAGLAYNKIFKYFLNIEDDNIIKVDLFKYNLFNIKK
ncbi:MAG: HesA/MoeB/ThiF family protein [Nanoarchaeota archaeon]